MSGYRDPESLGSDFWPDPSFRLQVCISLTSRNRVSRKPPLRDDGNNSSITVQWGTSTQKEHVPEACVTPSVVSTFSYTVVRSGTQPGLGQEPTQTLGLVQRIGE